MPVVVHQPQHQIPLFSLQDMRFFQHFLVRCIPHHPIGAEHIWTHEIPCLSEKYEYLMHAILGFAASELMSDDPSLVTPAMEHRIKAIRAVKRALAGAPRANTFEEGNALMATCFALTFQSVLLDDGMVEYMTFIRGIVIVAIQMYVKGAKLLFGEYLGDAGHEALKPYMAELPLVERSWVDAAVGAIRTLGPLCQNEIETTYHAMILEMAEQLYASSWAAYMAMTKHYGWWIMLPHDQFQCIIDPTSQTAVLLASHWIALKQIMTIITDAEVKVRAQQPPPVPQRHPKPTRDGNPAPDHDVGQGLLRWLKYLNGSVDAEHQAYNVWPMWVEAELERDPAAFGKTSMY